MWLSKHINSIFWVNILDKTLIDEKSWIISFLVHNIYVDFCHQKLKKYSTALLQTGVLVVWKADTRGRLQQQPLSQQNLQEQLTEVVLKPQAPVDPMT